VLSAIRYYWVISKGHRLRPWHSPYIRWRLETYFGAAGDVHGAREFFGLLWRERAAMRRFLDWAEERRRAQRKP
jgi:hypothetical protein